MQSNPYVNQCGRPAEMIPMDISLRSEAFSFLADHGFHDMVVLPGSFYISKAVRIYQEQFGQAPASIRSVRFVTPAILSDEDLHIGSVMNGPVCEFHQIEASGVPAGLLATLEIDGETSPVEPDRLPGFSIKSFQDDCGTSLNGAEFYNRLRENGNQYGPHFQIIDEIWRSDRRALARLATFARKPTAILDACTQLISALIVESGRAFALRSMATLHIHDIDLPETVWALAELQTPADLDEQGFAGEIRVFDESGKLYLHFVGVSFLFLDVSLQTKKGNVPLKLCIASTFTAEPLEDSLKFWGEKVDMPVEVEFAPYNQIFQQLLDPAGLFHRNSNGVNIIVLNLEDWARTALSVDPERADRCFGKYPRYTLPNGLQIVDLNRHETDYVFKEIFEDKSYLKHGIRLSEGDTVIDIGANIGLFSLFVASSCKKPVIYAFEPSPAAFQRLKANGASYIENFHPFNCGVSDRRKTANFTSYERSSVFSGFHSSETEDKAAIQAVIRNMLDDATAEDIEDLTADRLRQTVHECPLLSVSDIIRENGIEKIDLLKIDAEKSEWDILAGIEDADWAIIKQIVIEIHDRTGEAANRVMRLLAEKGFQCAGEQEKLLEHSGLFNVYATRTGVNSSVSQDDRASLDKNVDEFCGALATFTERSSGSLIVCVAPRTRVDENTVLFEEVEGRLQECTGQFRKVPCIGSNSILDRYPVENLYDIHTHQLGNIPYTPEGYASIGTTLFRTLFQSRSRPYKVIVLDCDNTLWQGECGEDLSTGVKLTEGHRYLQEFMLEQMKAGMLICLCSRNNEEDVFNVFDHRADMLLKRDHLASWRINWRAKSENLQAIAEELGLGLDSFIFVDDNPVECAEVKARRPAVLTLTLPTEAVAIPSFLKNVWAFDHGTLTDEDRRRTSFHQENTVREKLREQSLSLKQFIDGLNLKVEIHPPTPEQFPRVSQLTFRTNQFNLTTVRRSEEEIVASLKDEDFRCLIVSVSDRFGDYGAVGLLIYRVKKGLYVVDTFLLSCRALGRGVEHRILSELGRRALEDGAGSIEMTYHPTEKNQPALDFMTNIGAGYQSGLSFRFPTQVLADLRYDPDSTRPAVVKNVNRPGAAYASGGLQKIAEEFHDIAEISRAIARSKISDQPLNAAVYAAPGNNLEAALTDIWRRILGRAQIGINDNFFEAGGTSLKAVLVAAAVRKELKKALSIVTLFECPTIKLLAARLNPNAQKAESSTARKRGQLRRMKTLKRSAR